jgi:hypothetical protein
MDEKNKNDESASFIWKLDDAVRKGYIREIVINNDMISYRHPEYPLDSPSLQEGRFNRPGEIAFYVASGNYCGEFEVPNYYERVPCGVKNHTILAFDLILFANDYDLGDAFVRQRDDGGWDVCQDVSKYLTENHSVSGILYQSAACYKAGQTGICLAVLPGKEQTLLSGFFSPKSGDAKHENGGQSAPGPDSE